MPSHNCSKNLHSCQFERNLFAIIAAVFLMLNFAQVCYYKRHAISGFVRRTTQRLPVDEDQAPIYDRD